MGYTWHYYDLLLLGIFVSVALGAAIGFLTPLPLTLAVIGCSLVALVLVLHGLFVNGPVDEPADLTEEVERLN